jgi:regulator of replication initiation timing
MNPNFLPNPSDLYQDYISMMKNTMARLEQDINQLNVKNSSLQKKVEELTENNTDLRLRMANMKHLQPQDFEILSHQLKSKEEELLASKKYSSDQRMSTIKGHIFMFFFLIITDNYLRFSLVGEYDETLQRGALWNA